MILQGLNGNPTAVCFGLLYGDLSTSAEAVNRAKSQANLSILAVDGAVLGTLEGEWESLEKTGHPLHGTAVVQGELGSRTKAPKERSKFLLGDFGALGTFLASQLSQFEVNGGAGDAV